MRLAIINITGGGLSGGYKKYLYNMIPRLAGHKDITAMLCIWPKRIDSSTWFRKPENTDYCTYNNIIINNFVYIPDRKIKKSLKRFAPDVIFIPADRYIRFNDIPVVNMLRNMEPHVAVLKGDPFVEVIKKYIQYNLSYMSVRLADQTIAVSRYVAKYMADGLKISKKKISMAYHGTTPRLNKAILKPIVLPDGFKNNFLFTCGSIRPARGLEDLFKALCDERIRRMGIRLVIAGDAVCSMKKYRENLERLILSKGLKNRIYWAGCLNEDEIYWCFRNCKIFIMTSRVEACPNIAIEALSSGVLAIAADNPPLPEFFADCALYYQPGNGKSLSDAILKYFNMGGSEKNMMAALSRDRSLKYTWDSTVESTISVMKKVLSRSKDIHR